MSGLRVLVTNDDGVRAPGLRVLARAARELGYDVVVAAPAEEASGTGAAMTAYTSDGRVVVEKTGIDGITAYGVGASPGYIVMLAMLGAFGDKPDLVLSGINRGANSGRAIIHSGTVGAALTAAGQGRPALAVSLDAPFLDDEPDRHWETAAEYAMDLLPDLQDLPDGTALNLNVPDVPADKVKGLREATLAVFGQVQVSIAEQGEDFVRTAVRQGRPDIEADTDLALLLDGYATVTAIRGVTEQPGAFRRRTPPGA
jgi:5'/3'-nucleotidase